MAQELSSDVETIENSLGERPQSWPISELRKIGYDMVSTQIYSRSSNQVQYSYPFESPTVEGLSLRYTQNFPYTSGLNTSLWLLAFTEDGNQIDLAVDPAYVYQRTGCMVSPRLVHWEAEGLVSMFDIVSSAVGELVLMLNLQVHRFLSLEEWPDQAPATYLALDHRRECKVVMATDALTLQSLDRKIRTYSTDYWKNHQRMGCAIRIPTTILLYPTRSLWGAHELALLEPGDLLALQNFYVRDQGIRIRGGIRFKNHKNLRKQFEVFIQMNEEDTRLYFGSDDINASAGHDDTFNDNQIAPLEEIELEIHAGKTTVLFNDLCNVQAGTLIELREHSLPFVRLCVMGSPILEGELVNFQDQVMIQVTKRLD
jgi:flagellar motor switch/type III secretory pathway protein FliN